MDQVFRKEVKYRISVIQFARLEPMLAAILRRDRAGEKGTYRVRSLYFDSINDGDLRDVLSGNYSKKKIRLRVYDPAQETAKLELKVKHGPDQQKFSLEITRVQARDLMEGNLEFLREFKEQAAHDLYREMTLGVYRPKIIVDYRRTAFISDLNSIRITFDADMQISDTDLNLFSSHLNLQPLDRGDVGVLEVKYDDFLPSYIKDVLQHIDQLPEANSKYALGRVTC